MAPANGGTPTDGAMIQKIVNAFPPWPEEGAFRAPFEGP